MTTKYNEGVFSNDLHINADDVCIKGQLTLKRLLLMFQKVALEHYTTKAQSWDEVVKSGRSWVLTKMEIHINRLPNLSEQIQVATWSKGVHGIKGHREYEISCQGEILVKAQSEWIYLNFIEKKPEEFPSELFPNFIQVNRTNFKSDISNWRLKKLGHQSAPMTYSLRYTDFDINQHLNNTTYFELLEDALCSCGLKAKTLYATFKREIPFGTKKIDLFMEEDCESDDVASQTFSLEFRNDQTSSFLAKIRT